MSQNDPGWSTNNVCGGLSTNASDPQVWLDVTTTGDGVTPSNCATHAANCSIKDKITGHEWHRPAGAIFKDWSSAMSYCENEVGTAGTYNGKSDWRLPTQKELTAAYNDGLVSTTGGNWMSMGQMYYTVWTSTSFYGNIPFAWSFLFASGASTGDVAKTTALRVICTRP